MTDTHRRFSDAVELGVRLDNDWRNLERRIRDTIPDLAAAAYDTEPSDPVVWCWDHQQSVTSCHKADMLCDGEPTARHTDPTGNAAVSTRAWEDAGAYSAHAKRAAHHIEQMARIAGRYKPDDPQLTLDVEQENTKDACEVCKRSDKWVSADGTSQHAGRSWLLCTFHRGFLKRHDRMPTPDEEATHQRGKRVTARVSQLDRFRNGILTGKL